MEVATNRCNRAIFSGPPQVVDLPATRYRSRCVLRERCVLRSRCVLSARALTIGTCALVLVAACGGSGESATKSVTSTTVEKKPSAEAFKIGEAALSRDSMPFEITAAHQTCAGQSFIDDLGLTGARELAEDPPHQFSVLSQAKREATMKAFNNCLPGDVVGPAIADRWNKRAKLPPVLDELRDCVAENADGSAGEIAAGLQSSDETENDRVIMRLYEGCDTNNLVYWGIVEAMESQGADDLTANCVGDQLDGEISIEQILQEDNFAALEGERIASAKAACGAGT